jgi:phage-related minor tail protein
MAERIKGITVEIGGDTIGLQKAIKGVNEQSRTLQTELKDVQRLLKFDPNNAELLAQKQKLLNQQLDNTSNKLNTLREAEAQVQEQFKKGDIKEEQYRAFQRELADTEITLRNTQNALSNMGEEQQNVQNSTKQLQRLFEVTGKSVEDYSDVLGSRLVRAIQNGTATSKDLSRAFERIGTEATGSIDNVDQLREQINKLDSGEKTLKQVRREMEKLEKATKETESAAKNLGSEVGNIAAGAAAGVGLAGIFEKAMAETDLDTTIDFTFAVPEESKAAVKDSIQGIMTYGIDAETALEGVRRQWALNGEAGDAANQKIIKSAGAIAKSYGDIDFTQLIQESTEIASALGISQMEALAMTDALFAVGFPPDEIDIIAEYGSQLAMAGYSAEEIQAIFAAGVDTDSWNIDVLLDGVKEGRIRIAEFGEGIDKTTAGLIEGTAISAEQLKNWGAAVAGGGEEGSKAMNEVAKSLATVEDASLRNAIGTRLFGTLWEEQGKKVTDTLVNANAETVNLAGQTENLTNKTKAIDASPSVALAAAFKSMGEALEPLMLWIAGLIAKIAEWVQKNPELAATIAAITIGIGILIGIITFLAPIFGAIAAAATAAGIGIGAMAAPILIAIAIIAAIIAIGVLVVRNWDTIMKKAGELAATIKRKFEEFKQAAGEKMQAAKDKIAEVWGKVEKFFKDIDLKQMGKDAIQGLIDGIGSMAKNVKDKAEEVANGIGEKIKSILRLGSPSKLMMEMGEFTGEGLAIGLKNSMSQINSMSERLAKAAIPDININAAGATAATAIPNKSMTVNINSPKALDVREANKQFNLTLNKMSLMW